MVDVLVQAELYDMAFTVILKFWKGSVLKRCSSCFQLVHYHIPLFFGVSSTYNRALFVQGTGKSLYRNVNEVLSKQSRSDIDWVRCV